MPKLAPLPATLARLRLFIGLGGIAMLSACASQPQLTAQQEAGDYKRLAHRSYSAPGPSNDPWRPYIKEASERFDVPEKWIREVMRQESGGKALATSGPGAMGLMQVMPGTYDELRGRYRDLGADAYDPHDNILAGTAYVRELYDIYGSPGFLAAYNAGPGRLDDYLTRGRTLPTETRRYVASIGPRITGYEPGRSSPGAAFAMNAMPFDIPSGPRYMPDSRYASTPPVQLAAAPAPTPVLQPARQVVQVASLPEPVLTPVSDQIVLGRPTPVGRYAGLPPAAPEPSREPAIVLGRPTPVDRFATAEPITLSPPPSRLAEPSRQTPAQQFATFTPRAAEPSIPTPPPVPLPQFASYVEPSKSRAPFRLVSPAMAEPLARSHPPERDRGNWAVQVGAFANDRLAAAANASARDQARELSGAQATVSSVRQGSGTLYRARLHGLTHDSAQQACERLSRQRINCMLISPDAQS